MKIKCDLCGGELLMDAGGQTASCVDCRMKHSLERLREKLATHEVKELPATDEKTIVEEIFDSEWELEEPETYEAEWEPVLDPDESYYTKYLRFNAQLYPKSDKDSWEKIEWDIWSEGNCEFHIDFYDAAMSKLFPRDYVLCQNKKEKANGSITKRIDAIRDLYEDVRWNIQLSPEQIDIVDTLLAAFNDPKTALNGMKNQGSSEYSWEMSTCYPNHDTRREFKGAVDESNETLMQLKGFLLEILLQNVSERYPWIYNIDLNH